MMTLKIHIFSCLIAIFAVNSVISVNNLREEFTWTRISYDWGGNRAKRQIKTESRYSGYSEMQNDQGFYFPDTVPSKKTNYNSGSGSRPNSNYELISGNKKNNYQDRTEGRPSQNSQQNNGGNSWNQRPSQGTQQGSNTGSPSRTQTRENYIYQNNIPMGAGVWGDKLFITVPRRRHGVPSSLNYVSLNSPNKRNTPLIPYPNWEMNALPDDYNTTNFDNTSLSQMQRERFVSVYRVAVDACDRLWFVDTGRLEIPDAPIQVQAPKLVIMDLRTDNVLRQYTFPDSDIRPASLFAHVVVDSQASNCNNAHAYIADVSGYGLVVYNFRLNRSWRVTHNYFYLEPSRGEFQVAGHRFQWNDGVFSTALSPPSANGRRYLYFHSMAGSHIYRVPTELLTNETAATRSYHGNDFESLGDRGDGAQTSASALDEATNVLFLGLVNQNALACWNINSPLSQISIVQRDDARMIYPCDLKIYNNNIYFLTNTMPGFLYGQLNYDEVNFRVWIQNVQQAIQGTRCASGSGNRGNSGGSNISGNGGNQFSSFADDNYDGSSSNNNRGGSNASGNRGGSTVSGNRGGSTASGNRGGSKGDNRLSGYTDNNYDASSSSFNNNGGNRGTKGSKGGNRMPSYNDNSYSSSYSSRSLY